MLILSPSWQDGSANAPAGTPQHSSSILSAYAARPPWKVAGFDYAVGVPAGQSLTSWQDISGPGISVESTYLRLDSTNNVVFENIDFTTSGGAFLYIVGSNNISVINCKFGGSSYVNISTGVIVTDTGSTGLTVKYCELNGSGTTGSNEDCLVFTEGGGDVVFQYNWCYNMAGRVLHPQAGITLTYQYNLIDGGAYETGSSFSCLQWNGGSCQPTVTFNTQYWPATPSYTVGGEVFPFDLDSTGTMTNPICSNNTMICASGATPGISYFIHGWQGTGTTQSGTFLVENNYFDPTGATGGSFYSGSFTGAVTFKNNIDMITGVAYSDTPP